MPTPINPYIAGDPVGNSAAFVGRDDVLREVLKVLRNASQNAITLYGQRRIGKTSMLQYLLAHLPQEGSYQPVYFDLQDKAAWPLARLLTELARAIAEKLALAAPALSSVDDETFRTWLSASLANLPDRASLVLLFDEFDVLADPGTGTAAAEFFPYLRNLLTLDSTRLQFIFVLGRNINDLSSFALSVFKGVPSKRVSLLNRADTFKVAQLSQQNGTLLWPESALETVWDLTHGHPYLTQALCSQVWEAAYDESPTSTPTVTPSMIEAAAPAALETSQNILNWLWNGLGPAEKVVSAALAGAGRAVVDETRLEALLRESGVRILIRELQNAPQMLADWDILEPADGGYVFRVELLRRWMDKYHPLSRTQEELDRIHPVADSLFHAAESLYRQGNSVNAEDLFKQAISANPNHLRANELLAEILIAGGRLDEAREKLEKLLEFAPALARPRLVQVYMAQAEAATDDKTRLALYEKILGLDASRIEARAGVEKIKQLEQEEKELAFDFVEGRQALQRGEWARAIELFQKVVAQRPAYTYDNTDTAADLLSQAVRENKARPAKWKIWLRQTQTLAFLGGIALILLLIFAGAFGQKAFQTCVDVRAGYCGTLAPSFTPTLTVTLTPTATWTITPTVTLTLTPTFTPTKTLTPTLQAGSTASFHPNEMVMIYIDGAPTGNFWIDQTEVTTEKFLRFLKEVRYNASVTDDNQQVFYQDKQILYLLNNGDLKWDRIGWGEAGFLLKLSQYAQHPVIYVSWYGANKYCEWLGNGSHLPSAAEWQYAAYGPDNRTYPWGNFPPDATRANFKSYLQNTTITGKYSPAGDSYFGVQDMAGNVAEWVSDWTDASTLFKVLRGGSWYSGQNNLRSSDRNVSIPNSTFNNFGFRCVRPAP